MKSKKTILKIIIIILYIVVFTNDIFYSVTSIIAICIHELSHLIFLRVNGIFDVNLKISPLGFSINLTNNNFIKNENLIYLIGSISNIVVSILFYILSMIINYDVIIKFANVNFIIGIINLMPAFPLDGAIVLRNFLFKKLTLVKAINISIITSFFISLILFVFGINIIFRISAYNITYIVISGFIFITTYKEYKFLRSCLIVNNIYLKKDKFTHKGIVCVKTISVLDNVKLLELIKSFSLKNFLIIHVVDSKHRIIGVVNEYTILEYYKEFGNVEIKNCLYNKTD